MNHAVDAVMRFYIMNDYFMTLAIKEAIKAKKKLEVPVGCVVVLDNKVIARAHNLREKKQNAIAHAEILAIVKACKKIKSWRLDNCDIYITLEPCLMCRGAIRQARINNVYFGAYDIKSKDNYSDTSFVGGIMEESCRDLLQDFFKELRVKKENSK